MERPVALITGASRGIGAATANRFAMNGYDVALLSDERDELERVAESVRSAGARALSLAVDLRDLDCARGAVDTTLRAWGRIDALVNNAAWRTHQTMRTIELATWDATLRVCLTAPAFLAQWCARAMEERAIRGAIVNVSSIMAARASGTSPAYVVSKGALDALTYELAVLYGPVGIRVVAVNPGWVATSMSADYRTGSGQDLTDSITEAARDEVPLGRPATPEEIANAIVWLAGPEASYVTGCRFEIDGGWSHHHLRYGLHRMQFPDEFA